MSSTMRPVEAWAYRDNNDDDWTLSWEEPEICYEKVKLSSASPEEHPQDQEYYRCQPSSGEVSDDMLTAYLRAKESALANIQGFHHGGHHYVRDMRKPPGSQIIWEVRYITDYNAGHGAMINAIEKFVATEAIRAAIAKAEGRAESLPLSTEGEEGR